MPPSPIVPLVLAALVSLECGGDPARDADALASADSPRSSTTPAGSSEPAPETAPPSKAAQAAPVDPPPPAGVHLPLVGRARQIQAGNARTAYTWQGVFEVDPTEPAILAALASEGATPGWDAGDAALHLYEEQVEAAGAELTRGPGRSMYYDLEGLVVFANSGPQFHGGDPTGFTITVGPAGG